MAELAKVHITEPPSRMPGLPRSSEGYPSARSNLVEGEGRGGAAGAELTSASLITAAFITQHFITHNASIES